MNTLPTPPTHRPQPSTRPPRVGDASDIELAQRWTAGDRRAGDALIARYYDEISGHFSKAVGPQEARDLTQETFTQLCISAKRIPCTSVNVRGYLRGIARNVLNLHLRKRYRRRKLEAIHASTAIEVETLTPSQMILRLYDTSSLAQCLHELPSATLHLMDAFYWQERTADELGATLGVPAGTVRSRLFYTRRALQESLDQRPASLVEFDSYEHVGVLRQLFTQGPVPAA